MKVRKVWCLMTPVLVSGIMLLTDTGCVVRRPVVVVREPPEMVVPEHQEVMEVETQPPAPQVEVIPVAPSPNHIWVAGYWVWRGGAWVWMSGQYVVRPRADVIWVPGHWAQRGYHWVWVPGHWR